MAATGMTFFMIGSNGTGHGALAGLLAEQGVNVLICGGIGGGAQTALTEAGIELCAGAQGNTDQAISIVKIAFGSAIPYASSGIR